MIQDLKADSARWEQERRAASRSSGGGAGGTMNSSTPNAVFVRSSNSPVGSREPRGGPSDYSAWKNRQREQQEYEAAYASSAMDIDYAPAQGAAGNPVYGGQPYPGGPPAGYPAAAYPPPVHAAAAQYTTQPGYGYPPNPPPTQYSPQPQTSGDRYSAMAPPPMQPYGQDPAAFVHGSNYQAAGGYPAAGPTRIPPMPLSSAPPSRTYSAPVTGGPVYGSEADPYGYPPPAGNPVQAFPADALYGRGAYTTAAVNPPEPSSDKLGSPAGATQRQGSPAPPETQYEDLQSPPLQSATTPTNATPAQMASNGAPAPRRDRDSEPRERERERDHRDHRPRRSEPERDERQERPRHRHR